jgi:hypothetical protein
MFANNFCHPPGDKSNLNDRSMPLNNFLKSDKINHLFNNTKSRTIPS